MEEFESMFNIDDLKLESSTIDKIIENKSDTNTEDEDNKSDDLTLGNTVDDKSTNENKTEENDKTPSSESNDDSSSFSVFANLLQEEGVLSLDDEELKNVKSSADLVELVKKQIEKSKFENLSESQKRYLDAVEAGIPQAEFEKLEIGRAHV